MSLNSIYVSPINKLPLKLNENIFYLSKSEKKEYPIINNIPRFVEQKNYASSFGLQWNRFSKTQLDSHSGTTISKDRLQRICGGDLSIFKDKKVLEIGCGAGRFTEVMLKEAAHVQAVDLSSAVEANYQNCSHFKNYNVCQASVYELPFMYESFDIVICIGVIQHTPNPEKTISALCKYVKQGGQLFVDHYTHGYPTGFFRRKIRKKLLKKDPEYALRYCEKLTKKLFPIHKLMWKFKKRPVLNIIGRAFIHFSPLVDYHDTYPELSEQQHYEWMFLDTHDTLTDFYKHKRSEEEIKTTLGENKMSNIHVEYAGNGVEARAIKE